MYLVYKIKLHFLVFVMFFFNVLGTNNIKGEFIYGLKILIKKFTKTKNFTQTKKYHFIVKTKNKILNIYSDHLLN